jgi:hypothetical protein
MTEVMGIFLITKKEPIGSCINSVGIVTLGRDDLRSHLKSVGIVTLGRDDLGSHLKSVGIVTLGRDDLRSHLNYVGIAGFEPATSCSQSRRDNRTTLYPENVKNEQKNCGQGRNRTGDTRLFRPLLYLLSYLSIGNKTTIKHKYPQKFK